MVTSINGRTTGGTSNNIYQWSSSEDQNHFFSLIAKNNLIVMGRKTYHSAKPYIKLVPGKLRIVLTRQPMHYQTSRVTNQLEFSNESPRLLVQRLAKAGYKHMLLVGGSDIAAQFLKEKLVHHIFLTLEPYLFGQGKLFLDHSKLNIKLQLKKITRLNLTGTLLLKYATVY